MEQNNSDFSAQPDGLSGKVNQPADASQGEQTSTETPEFVSKKDHDRELQNLERRLQGLVDRNTSRLDKRVSDAVGKIDQAIEAGKAVGIQYTPEQEEAMRDRAVRQAMSAKETAQPSDKPTLSQGKGQPEEHLDPFTQVARLLYQRSGVQLTPNDPEWSLVTTDAEDPDEYLDSVRASIKAYKARLDKPKSQAAAPSTAGKGSSAAKPNADDYRRDMKNLEIRGNKEKIADVKERYRKAGLDVDHTPLYGKS